MARRNLSDKLVHKSLITEELRLINGSETDYITPSGSVYKDYGNDMFLKKKTHISTSCGITYKDGNKQRRVHRLVAEAYLQPRKFTFCRT